MIYVFYEKFGNFDRRPVLFAKCLKDLCKRMGERHEIVIGADTQWELDDYTHYFKKNHARELSLSFGDTVEESVRDKPVRFRFVKADDLIGVETSGEDSPLVFTGSANYETLLGLKDLFIKGDLYTVAQNEEDLENHKKLFIEFEARYRGTEQYERHRDRIEEMKKKEGARFVRIE